MSQQESYLDHLYVVVLCGGGGTRVWPLSVKKKPKQFLNFYSNQTLYQETVERAKKLTSPEKIIIITNHQYEQEVLKETPEIPRENIIAEPQKKNTAMAMGVAAALVKKRDNDAVIVNLASDHVVGDLDVYFTTLKNAAKIAYEDRRLVTVGIEPTYAHPGFGYIRVGKKVKTVNDMAVCEVEGFREKPDIKTAQEYVESGKYLWNANFYTWRADVILTSFDTLSPQIAASVHSVESALGTDREKQRMVEEYGKVSEEPIDTAISEKSDNLVVLRGKFKWNDIGSWEVVYELGKKDGNGNVVVRSSDAREETPVVVHDAKNNLIYCNNQALAIVGLSDIVIVDTGEGILVCDRKRSNDVKKIVEQLKLKKLDKYL